jgi:hypothetical protein
MRSRVDIAPCSRVGVGFLVPHSDLAWTVVRTVIYRGQICGVRLAVVDKGEIDSLGCLVSMLQTMRGSAAC